MDKPEDYNATDKLWDHPWTTEEMREHRDDWSLAADAGLLRHLQQFSDNLNERYDKTQEKLNSLSSELEEASVTIDNVTNISLALANTQFIESRVREDDVEMNQSQKTEEAKPNNKEQLPNDLIACVSESIKQGLRIMDEKFERLEILPSDSEDEGEIPVPSIVLKPNDPYKNRALPYVIGSEKWKASRKVGLESSSSESEMQEGEEESSSENEDEMRQGPATASNRRESSHRSLSSTSSSEMSGRNERGNVSKDYNSISSRTDKLTARSQDTLNSGSEIATPRHVHSRAENSMKAAPSFAEELAKRLGNVLPSNRTVKDNQDTDQSSINRYKDDLFASDGNDVFDVKSDNLFSEGNNLFEEEVSSSLWKNKPYRPPPSNIIPASLDVPPPMNAEATKPKSAFDDLCGDPESDDSDSIFAPKNSAKNLLKSTRSSSYDKREESEGRDNKLLNAVQSENNAIITTSTPEINDNGGLFGDENDYVDDTDLFGGSSKSRNRILEKTPEVPGLGNRTAPPGFPITQADILSSSIGNRLFQRTQRQESTDSSDTESSIHNANSRANERLGQESDSSGISMRPNNTINNSTNNTSGLGVDFQPQSESTRLKSEEIYRERFPSDSLFEERTRQPEESIVSGENSSVLDRARIVSETLDSGREDDLDVDDVFGPPPLPKPNDSKSKSNDDLFSNSSSESRSHASFDLLGTSETQYSAKIRSARAGGLFDEDIDIFGDGDVPQIDIFGEAFRSNNLPARKSSEITRSDSGASSTTKKLDLFAGNVRDIPKLTTADSEKPPVKTRSIFDDSEEEDDDDDLFGGSFLKNNRKAPRIAMEGEDDDIFANKSSGAGSKAVYETKKEPSGSPRRDNVAKPASEQESKTTGRLPSLSGSGLFDNLDESDDALFARGLAEKKERVEKKLFDDSESEKEESVFKANGTKIEDSIEEKVSRSSEIESDQDINTDSPRKEISDISPLKRDDSSEKLFNDEGEVSSPDGAMLSRAPEVTSDAARRDPPKSLSLRIPTGGDDSSQVLPRRAISSKIQNLMGKMGNMPMPVWKKSEEKPDSELERGESKDSDDGAFMSVPDMKSPTLGFKPDDDEVSSESIKEPLPSSPLDDSGNSESAVSFDVPAQVEVLAVGASKSRARIQAKRRPQSRHARQTALRKSGIDFDTVDNTGADAVESDPSDNTFSSDKIPEVVTDPPDVDSSGTNRLGKSLDAGKTSEKTIESSYLVPEDKSDLSFSKECSLSLNKNTLLSPSTDEEDLFDVPPDLPEDPPKEETDLFGRAPILSPIEPSYARAGSKDAKKNEDSDRKSSKERSRGEKGSETESDVKKPMDPLRDNTHDPIKDPSSLFAFVTKTPSPEKGQNVLFREDASLFTHLAKKSAEEARTAAKKPTLDLFADDSGGDLFSESLAKSSKKSIRSAKPGGLFDDLEDAEDDAASDLFGSRPRATREKTDEPITSKSSETSGRASPSRSSLFADNDDVDDDDDLLFSNASDKKASSEVGSRSERASDSSGLPAIGKITKDVTKINDIFGDQSSGEEDLFAKSRVIGSTKVVGAGGSIFSSDPDDADDIFSTKTSGRTAKAETPENRSSTKKALTRDLKKTAETIAQDPLSMLQDD